MRVRQVTAPEKESFYFPYARTWGWKQTALGRAGCQPTQRRVRALFGNLGRFRDP